MYAIRVDANDGLLRVELSGRMSTEEALRALSQAFTLADASDITRALCDVSALERGPAATAVVAGALAVRCQPGTKLAFIGTERHFRVIRRLVRFAGIRDASVRNFDVAAASDAEAWLAGARPGGFRLAATEARHARQILSAGSAPALEVVSDRAGRHSAA